MRLASFFIGLGAIVLTTACSSETGIQEGVLDVGGSAGSSGSIASSGGAPSFGGSGGAPSSSGAAGRVDGGQAGAIAGGSSNGGASSGGSPETGGTSSANGGSAGAGQSGASSDGGPQSSCSSSLSGQTCTAGASCSHISADGCSAVNCLCSSGKWACAQSSGSCGKCPAAQQAQCGDPCSVVAQGCLCQCGGGPNFSGCSCTSGSWQCLGC